MSKPGTSLRPDQNNIGDEISLFVHNIDALHLALPPQVLMAEALLMACAKGFKEFLEKYGKLVDPSAGAYTIEPEQFLERDRLLSRVRKAHASTVILPQTFLIALVSQYDSFLGGLLRCLYRARPGLLKQSDKHLTYAELAEFTDIEHAKAEMLEKEVEHVLRKSHPDQFTWMENKFDLKLRQGLPAWPLFVELTQRRHLFAHCYGKVSSQYLKVCDEHKVKHEPRPSQGDKLDVSTEYFERAHACVFEIGTKLGHVLWRKVMPEQQAKADGNLLMLGFDLLVSENYDLAVTMGTFALDTIKRHSNEDMRRRMVINLAQAYRWGGDQAEADKRINEEDWSSCSPEFQMAVAVLKDDFERAAKLMRSVAAADLLPKTAYRDWPLFKEFRKSQAFLETYRSIYGHELAPIEPSPPDALFAPYSKLRDLGAASEAKAAEKSLPEQTAGADGASQQPGAE